MMLHQINAPLIHQIFSEKSFNLNTYLYNKEEELQNKEILLKKAMQAAWDEYGLKSPIRKQIVKTRSANIIADIFVTPFQPTGSEWDDKITETPVSVFDRDITKPGYFNALLKRSINFEVNNHELADFGRKLVLGILIGNLIVLWIVVGMFFGLIPLQWLIFNEKRSSEGSIWKRNAVEDSSGITNRIMLSLDSDWLKKLEEKVRKDPRGNFVRTYAHCCILPDSEANGLADCHLVRKSSANNNSTFNCLSDLVYDFEFGQKPKGISSTINN